MVADRGKGSEENGIRCLKKNSNGYTKIEKNL